MFYGQNLKELGSVGRKNSIIQKKIQMKVQRHSDRWGSYNTTYRNNEVIEFFEGKLLISESKARECFT